MQALLDQQKAFFNKDLTKDYNFRVRQLMKLKLVIKNNETEILEALHNDLYKSNVEAYTTEVGFILSSIDLMIKNLRKWMRPTKVKTPLFMFGSKSFIVKEPLGSVLIIGPYNYPFQLVIEPLIGAMASGNTAIIKPSEYTKSVEAVLVKIINETFDESYIKVVTGEVDVTTNLLSLKFDHIFFTGSTNVGKIVYQAASKNLIPVTLELGGKSPTIVDASANIKIAARRIIFGKLINAGQTCIAPDYIYVASSVHDALIEALIKAIEAFYPNHQDLGHIVNERHFERLTSLIDKKKVVYGGTDDAKTNFIAPTIMTKITWDDQIMKEEIFGPIIPVLEFDDIDDVITTLKIKEKPLALYLFSEDEETIKKVFKKLSFGNGAINETLMQVANPNLPFGGVGQSGMGHYHGLASFDTFSNTKTYTKKTTRYDIKLAYPPYSKSKVKWIKRLLK